MTIEPASGVVSAINDSNAEVLETLAVILGLAVSILSFAAPVTVFSHSVLVDDGALFVVE